MGDDPVKMADLNGSSDDDMGEAHCSADTPPPKKRSIIKQNGSKSGHQNTLASQKYLRSRQSAVSAPERLALIIKVKETSCVTWVDPTI